VKASRLRRRTVSLAREKQSTDFELDRFEGLHRVTRVSACTAMLEIAFAQRAGEHNRSRAQRNAASSPASRRQNSRMLSSGTSKGSA
jgi:hypothetical protein